MKRLLSAFVILTLIMFVVPVHVVNAEDLADKMGKKYMWIWKSGSYIIDY